jgi:hypothetical protein
MAFLQLAKILEGAPSIKRDGTAFLITEEADATAYISLGQEVLQVARVSRVELGAEHSTFTTHKNERFYFPNDQVVGWRMGGESKTPRSHAGFAK